MYNNIKKITMLLFVAAKKSTEMRQVMSLLLRGLTPIRGK